MSLCLPIIDNTIVSAYLFVIILEIILTLSISEIIILSSELFILLFSFVVKFKHFPPEDMCQFPFLTFYECQSGQ